METSYNSDDKIDILKFLENYPDLQLQYLFLNCFVISSKEIMSLYKKAKLNQKNNLDNVEIYYTPKYLYEIKKDNPIFEIINKQVNKKYYYLKEHIFYYQYLLRCIKIKNEKVDKNTIDTSYINEISYRTLLNRLYFLSEDSNSNINYGISEILGVPCIYSKIESNIIEQIINMKKFTFELLQMNEDKVLQLFGINEDIDKQSFIYNKILISISEGNSPINITNDINYDKNDGPNKINKGDSEIEKILINISSELFLFNYIIKQFDKDKLILLPRMLFFCCLYDDKCRNIYQIQAEKTKSKKNIGKIKEKIKELGEKQGKERRKGERKGIGIGINQKNKKGIEVDQKKRTEVGLSPKEKKGVILSEKER